MSSSDNHAPAGRKTPAPAGLRARRLDSRGLTLIELLISLTISTFVLTAIFSLLINVQRSWSMSRTQLRSRQNERASLDLMTRDIRVAGSGYGGRPITTAGIPGNTIYPLEPTPGDAGSDTLIITGDFRGVQSTLTAALGSAAAAITVPIAEVGQFSVGDLIVVTNGTDANMFEITTINEGTGELVHDAGASAYNNVLGHVVWPAGGYPSGSRIVAVERVSYWVDDSGSIPLLMRRTGGEDPLTVGADIAQLHVLYRSADGTLATNPADPSLVRSVVLRYVKYSAQFAGVASSEVDTMMVQIQPRVLS